MFMNKNQDLIPERMALSADCRTENRAFLQAEASFQEVPGLDDRQDVKHDFRRSIICTATRQAMKFYAGFLPF